MNWVAFGVGFVAGVGTTFALSLLVGMVFGALMGPDR